MTAFRGLSVADVQKRFAQYGPNAINVQNKSSSFDLLIRQIKGNFIIYLLFAASLLSFIVGKSITAYTIWVIIVLIVVVGFFQEYKVERAIEALQKMVLPISTVIRNGKEIEVHSSEIVPGDIIVLRIGERIPADAVILESFELRVNEAALTGESQEVAKSPAKDKEKPENTNLVFMGTFMVNGRCVAEVMHTGMNTSFGKIAQMISSAQKSLILHDQVNQVAKYMVYVAIGIAILTGIILFNRLPEFSVATISDIIITMVAIAVSAFPEALPVVLITTLSIAAYRMAGKNAIVKRVSVIESLGEVTVICSDKTGTITKGEMTVKEIYLLNQMIDVTGTGFDIAGEFQRNGKPINPNANPATQLLLKTAVLCNQSRLERQAEDAESFVIKGSPTEGALLVMATKAGIFPSNYSYEIREEIPFSSERKMMAVLCEEKNQKTVYAKGAPEVLIEHCTFIHDGEKAIPLTQPRRKLLESMVQDMSQKKLRVMALAYQNINHEKKDWSHDLCFLGLVGMEDPPRSEVKGAIEACRKAGIEVKMITGDNSGTAVEIGREIGLVGTVLTGAEMDAMTDDELFRLIPTIQIFARVRPDHKIRIISALKKRGEVVAMTGDGINDAPALKEADVGIAMGRNGTDVSREAADLILKDDNFATIVEAIKEGRTVFQNIQKFLTYQLSCNSAELFIIFIGILIGLPLPLLALQIIFMNLVTSDLPAITLGFHPSSNDILSRPSRKSKLFNPTLIKILLVAGITMGVITLAVYYAALNVLNLPVETARTMALLTLICFEIVNAFNFRSFRHLVIQSNPLSNRPLVAASIISLLATGLIIYTPFFQAIFEVNALTLEQVAICAFSALSIMIAFDLLKLASRKKGGLYPQNSQNSI